MENLRPLGHSNLLLSPIGLGTWQFSNQGKNWWKPVSSHLVCDIIKASLQGGINWPIHAHGSTVFAISGASTLKQAQSNLEAQNFRLTEADLQKLSEISDRLS